MSIAENATTDVSAALRFAQHDNAFYFWAW
jgi:hypothetical protein